MPGKVHFVEYLDGRIEKVEGEVSPEALGPDVAAAYTVASVISRRSVFHATDLLPKKERRIKMQDGVTMKFKSEMTPAELEWYSAQRRESAQLAAKNRKTNAAASA